MPTLYALAPTPAHARTAISPAAPAISSREIGSSSREIEQLVIETAPLYAPPAAATPAPAATPASATPAPAATPAAATPTTETLGCPCAEATAAVGAGGVAQAAEPAAAKQGPVVGPVAGPVAGPVETYPDCGLVPSPAPRLGPSPAPPRCASPVRVACTEFTPFRRAHAPGPWSIGPNGPVYNGAVHGAKHLAWVGVMPGAMPRHTLTLTL